MTQSRSEQVVTRIPTWSAPAAAAGESLYGVQVPADLTAAARRVASAHGVGLHVVLLAASLKVLHAVTQERDVQIGYLADGSLQRLVGAVDDGTWSALIADAARAQREAVEVDSLPLVVDVRAVVTPGVTELDFRGDLRMAYRSSAGRLTMSVTYQADRYAEDFVQRLAGYHLAALRLMAADAGAHHDRQSLLGADEISIQLHQLGGPRRTLPESLFVELFEERVTAHPDAEAAGHGSARWTYAELNARANQIAHHLLRSGLRDEEVVAVVLDRHLDWIAAMLGVFKAGGVYLPVRPDFPAGRIATQLSRSDCRFAVTDAHGLATLEAAVAKSGRQCSTVLTAEAFATGETGNPGRPVGADQLAYIYFTSGSTGEPKGAMCEHAGMLNHLLAKIEDMRLAPGEVVTQIASQCFDISLWQVVAPLLVGGRTEVIDTGEQLDVARFVRRLAHGGVHVIQIVPAYLDVMLSHLEKNPSPLGDLRSISVTGEALKLDLVRRWFAVHPGITLVNAYGATEVSDDTMHAVLDGVSARPLGVVTVGTTLRNVNTYILDRRQRLVPLGAPGEIVFSGVCVGRGYVNDPDRTAQAFTFDPYRPAERLYRTGDFGRWLPEGTIEFLGRRDEQVKIRGYRIEIGEIENRLLQAPGVDEAAVIVGGDSEGSRHLVAFFVGPAELEPADLRDFLAAALPDYMVAQYFHRLERLPLTENGKVAKRALAELARSLAGSTTAYVPLRTATEHRLATAWAEVLNVPLGRIGRADDFFRLGGTSLAAVRLVVKLNRKVSLRDVVAHPALGDLAAAIDRTSGHAGKPPAPLLQRLSLSEDAGVKVICFPYAGGNALNFQRLARELAPGGMEVYGVELPGHDLASGDEAFAGVADVARRLCDELDGVDGQIVLWGHETGAAYALEVARLLEAGDRPPAALLVGAQQLASPGDLRRHSDEVQAWDDREITDCLHRESAYVELDLMSLERAELVGRAFRHDVRAANEYLTEIQERPRDRLRVPLHVILAADDTATGNGSGGGNGNGTGGYRSWEVAAETVVVHWLPEGGHYFVRSVPDQVAELIRGLGYARPGQPA